VKQTVGIAVLMALMGAPLAAQRPMTPSDYQPPPAPTAGQPPAGPAGPAGSGKQKPKDDENAKGPLRSISIAPLAFIYFIGTTPPATDPAFDDGHFYVALKSKALGAWDIKTTYPVWSLPDLPVTQPPVVDKGRIYIVLDGEVAAIDTTSSKTLWRVPTGGKVTAVPIAKSGWLILALENGEIHAIRGESGEVVWKSNVGAPVTTLPVIVGDRLYVAPQNKQLIAIDLTSGEQLWKEPFDEVVTAIAAQEQRVFISTGRMFLALDHAGHLKWKRRIGADAIGQPLADESTVYAAFTDNTLLALGANKGDLKWRAPLVYRPIAGPTRAHNAVLLSGIAPVIHVYDAKEGKLLQDYALPSDPRSILSSPIHVSPGKNFFEDTVLVQLAQGQMAGAQTLGPAYWMPFTDPGQVRPQPTLPGEPPPTPTAATAAPPKS
jgi:outer membrane protein assembly factor BamB